MSQEDQQVIKLVGLQVYQQQKKENDIADNLTGQADKYNLAKQHLNGMPQEKVNQLGNQGKALYMQAFQQAKNQPTKTQYQLILEKLGNQKYIDQDFPPELKSLVGENIQGRAAWRAIKWMRPQEFFTQGYKLFDQKIEPDDIKQGSLGDCYFLSVISSLAEHEERIKRIFPYPQINPQGCYCVRLLVGGELQEIIVDDLIPCNEQKKSPAFTKSNGPEIWVLLLEKAWAKVNKSYDNIEGGLPNEVMHDLTFAPTKFLLLSGNRTQQQKDEMWAEILKGEKNNYIMTCDSYQQPKVESIVPGHAYSLLDAHEFQFEGKLLRLVRIRNPWGKKEWEGNWGDNDPRWDKISENDKKEIEFTKNTGDGTFIMDYEEFPTYFENFQICYINDTYQYAFCKSLFHKQHAKYFNITIPQNGVYFISANQKSRRQYDKSRQKNFSYSTVTLVLGRKVGPNKYEYIEGQQSADREVWTAKGAEDPIQAGEYVVYVKAKWNYQDEQEIVLSVYGQDTVKIQEISKAEASNFLESVYLDHAQRFSKAVKNFAAQKQPNSNLCLDKTDDGFCYLAIWNQGQKTFNASISFNLAGMKLRKPYRGVQVDMKVAPGQSSIALFRVENYVKGFNFQATKTALKFV